MSVVGTMGSTGGYGGQVLSGDPRLIISGMPVAVNGGLFFCPVPDGDGIPHGFQTIIGTGMSLSVNGQVVAQMGDSCCRRCNNPLIPATHRLMLGK